MVGDLVASILEGVMEKVALLRCPFQERSPALTQVCQTWHDVKNGNCSEQSSSSKTREVNILPDSEEAQTDSQIFRRSKENPAAAGFFLGANRPRCRQSFCACMKSSKLASVKRNQRLASRR